MAQRNQLFAEVLTAKGFDLNKDYFTLRLSEVCELDKIRKSFRFSGKSSIGRSRTQNFWYAAQRGYKKQ